jgi:(p)ppGpp synthase/HD superfamily hydrolase
MWSWGEKGLCCDKHAAYLRQRAPQLEQQVHITSLQYLAPPPMTRDERITHIATHMADQAEIEQLKANGAQLYTSNTQLAAEVRRLGARNQQLESTVADHKQALEDEKNAHAETIARHNDTITELQRLQLAAQYPQNALPHPDFPTSQPHG